MTRCLLFGLAVGACVLVGIGLGVIDHVRKERRR